MIMHANKAHYRLKVQHVTIMKFQFVTGLYNLSTWDGKFVLTWERANTYLTCTIYCRHISISK